MTVNLGEPRNRKFGERRARKGDPLPAMPTGRPGRDRGLLGFARDRSGGIAIYAALSITALLGFVGMSIDIGTWYSQQRNMQSAADAAAMAGALAVARGENHVTVGKQTAIPFGYAVSQVQINRPPSVGPNSGSPLFVEAIITKPDSGFTAGLFRSTPVNITSRAVARTVSAMSCVYSLNPTDAGALTVQGGVDLNLGCGAQVNSTDPASVVEAGVGCINAPSVTTAGGTSGDCIAPSGTVDTAAPVGPNPFAYLSPPPVGGCDYAAGFPYPVSGGTVTLIPGNYCDGIEISGGDVTFSPGQYTFGGEGMHVSGGAIVNGTGVMIFFPKTVDGNGPPPPGDLVSFSGTTTVTLKAPTTGPYKGILMYAEPGINPDLGVKISGGANMNLTGVLYFPESDIEFAGNTDTSSPFDPKWTVVIGDTVTFSGASTFADISPLSLNNLPVSMLSASLAE